MDAADSNTSAMSAGHAPKVSIVLIVYRMARQAENTIFTLSHRFQRDVAEADYEIVVVENASDWQLDPARIAALGDNIRYFCRQEDSASPAAAINFGLAQCRGGLVGLMIDGARMVTPRVVGYALDAWRISTSPIVVVPGYHLGTAEHHENVDAGYDEAAEKKMLARIDWQRDGYRLFSVACFSGANPHGFFQPLMESNCMFATADAFARIGGADESFQLPGGGALNLHMFRKLGLLPGTRYFLLPGEGSFHQFHGGVTTVQTEDRQIVIERQRKQLQEKWGDAFHSVRREPALLGAVTGWALPFLCESARLGGRRFDRLRKSRQAEWPDEPADEDMHAADGNNLQESDGGFSAGVEADSQQRQRV